MKLLVDNSCIPTNAGKSLEIVLSHAYLAVHIHFLAPFRIRFMSRMEVVLVNLCLASEEIRTVAAVTNGPFGAFLCPIDRARPASGEATRHPTRFRSRRCRSLPIISPSMPPSSPVQFSSKDVSTVSARAGLLFSNDGDNQLLLMVKPIIGPPCTGLGERVVPRLRELCLLTPSDRVHAT